MADEPHRIEACPDCGRDGVKHCGSRHCNWFLCRHYKSAVHVGDWVWDLDGRRFWDAA